MRVMTRRFLFDIMQKREGEDMKNKLDYLEDYLLSKDSYLEDQRKELKLKISNLNLNLSEDGQMHSGRLNYSKKK